MRSDAKTRELLARVDAALRGTVKQVKLLGAIAWPRSVELEFFASGARELPSVSYEIDRDAANARIAALDALERSIDGDDEIATWLRAVVHSFIDGNRLLLAMGTAEFYRVSLELYGGAHTRATEGAPRNVDLADHLVERLKIHGWDEACDAAEKPWSDVAFADWMRARLAERYPSMSIEVTVDEAVTAKVLAGMHRVRVRQGAVFARAEAESLWVHEIETHALSAHNGARQHDASFLQAGGPRSTRVQEGLAIFTELYHHTLTTDRMQRLARRVKLVEMAEQGASFLDLYRFLSSDGSDARDAFFDAQRVCRGGRIEGGAPFTKDVVYLAGLLEVYAFMRTAIRGGYRDEGELMVVGRIALEDMPALVQLRHRGILQRPEFIPDWLANWRSLLPYFAFASFATELDARADAQRFARVIELAESQRPPRHPRTPE